jgi:protein-tyrosine phosphatase
MSPGDWWRGDDSEPKADSLTQTASPAGQDYLSDPRRRIVLPGVLNLRDVGGYPVADGGSVRWRALFRSDSLHRLEAAGVAAVTGLGLQTVVDLRTQAEVDAAPSPVRGRAVHVPLLPKLDAPPGAGLAAIYAYAVDSLGANIAAAVTELARGHALPALVHCTAGKDRTGLVIALTLAVLGVPDELIAADYAASETYLDADKTPVIGQLQASTGMSAERTAELLASPPGLILAALDRAREQAGSAAEYLRAGGMSERAIGRLRAALIVQ